MKARLCLLLLLPSCTPYERHSGEFFAGAVDPSNFPSAYLGAGGDPKHGGGVFTASQAFVKGAPVSYYPFPFSSAQSAADDPLLLPDPQRAVDPTQSQLPVV